MLVARWLPVLEAACILYTLDFRWCSRYTWPHLHSPSSLMELAALMVFDQYCQVYCGNWCTTKYLAWQCTSRKEDHSLRTL